MSKMKKYLLTGISYVLVAALAIGGTFAYLQDSDEDVNVMTLGNVQIEQHEYERATNADGSYKTDTIDGVTSYVLQDFTQAKPLYPAIIPANGSLNGVQWDYDPIYVRMSQVDSYGGAQVFNTPNAVDKFVTVENTGKTDAYVRTIYAFESGSVGTIEELDEIVYSGDFMSASKVWITTDIGFATIDGNNYYLVEYIYNGAKHLGGNHDGFLPAGETTYAGLCQVYMKSTATNEDCVAIDGNGNGTYDILVLSQAVQTAGFENAKTALDTAFGKTADKAAEWFGGVSIPSVFSWEGVNYITEDGTATASAAGGDTIYRGILSEGKSTASDIVIGEGIVRLNNRALCKDMNLKTVTLPNSLTYIDEGVFQQSGFVEIEVPENVTYIGKTAFGACPDLEKIVIKAKNVTFANYVGRDSGNLKEVYIYSDTVTFESGSMYFTNAQTGDASKITFYVSNQAVADALFNASSASRSYGMLIKSIDGATEYYNTLK